jgi:eukaryotic-like serine/threonine-protein kinase
VIRSPVAMNEPVATAREPLLRFGRYEVLMPVSDDGFVTTSIARVRGPSVGPRMVELVRVAGALSREAEVRAAFLAEARAAGRIRHTNFVHPTDTLAHDGDLFGATEFVLGVRLEELMQAARRSSVAMPMGIAARIVLDVLAGLSAVHATTLPGALARQLVHGDVAPSNIVISYRGVARLVHSGLSVAASRIGAIDRRNPRLAYKAPEQLLAGLHAVPIGPGADLFAVAVISWEILANQRLFEAESDLETVEKVLHAPLPTDAAFSGRDLLPSVRGLVDLALDRRPVRPTTSAADFGDALEQALGSNIATGEDVALYVDQLLGPSIDAVRENLHAQVQEADSRASERSGTGDFSGELPIRPTAVGADRSPPSSGRIGKRSVWPAAAGESAPPSSQQGGASRSVAPVPMAALAEPTPRPAVQAEASASPAGLGDPGGRPGALEKGERHVSKPRLVALTRDVFADGVTVRTVSRKATARRMLAGASRAPRPQVGLYLAIGALVGLLAVVCWRFVLNLRSGPMFMGSPIKVTEDPHPGIAPTPSAPTEPSVPPEEN